ncbi:MAG: winged helix-turn-helix transcriptional regulator [Gemmatimonadaceae bacterium]|nr:winged helix-turn-helix transcriptional regulator [Chitinophagaceae bacterium]
MLRNIGHELLLRSGDKTSRVLPVKKISSTEFQIRFENELEFSTDSLVSIVKRSLADNRLSRDYIVNVLTCKNNEIIFGYSIVSESKYELVPCLGRVQPKSCYLINILFQPQGFSVNGSLYLLAFLPLLAIGGWWMIARRHKKPAEIVEIPSNAIRIGSIEFDAESRTISANGTLKDLTQKETKLLSIFASAPNELIERSRLQKEIWEDEGVIVSRSLDMYISRLRKKLDSDPAVRIVNIHGKGYRLEIEC